MFDVPDDATPLDPDEIAGLKFILIIRQLIGLRAAIWKFRAHAERLT